MRVKGGRQVRPEGDPLHLLVHAGWRDWGEWRGKALTAMLACAAGWKDAALRRI